jgi:hypothetical protein
LHAVREEVLILELKAGLGKGFLDWLHRGRWSGGDGEVGQVYGGVPHVRPSSAKPWAGRARLTWGEGGRPRGRRRMLIERALPAGQSIHPSPLSIFRWRCTVPTASPTTSASSRTVGEWPLMAISSRSVPKVHHFELTGTSTLPEVRARLQCQGIRTQVRPSCQLRPAWPKSSSCASPTTCHMGPWQPHVALVGKLLAERVGAGQSRSVGPSTANANRRFACW